MVDFGSALYRRNLVPTVPLHHCPIEYCGERLYIYITKLSLDRT